MFEYFTKGTCSRKITFDIVDGCIQNLRFEGGCDGNLKGVAKLAEGMRASEVVERLRGLKCGWKNTSCQDQLARAIEEALEKSDAKKAV